MPRGVYIKTIAHRLALSKAITGKKLGPMSEESKRKKSLAMKGKKRGPRSLITKLKLKAFNGEASPNWIKDPYSNAKEHYHCIHKRIRKLWGKANRCEICERVGLKQYEWSNKDHKYQFNREDWQTLCHRCHHHYDARIGFR